MPPYHLPDVTRRSVLKASGAAISAGVATSSSAAAEPSADAYEDDGFQFDTVIDMVDAGADPTGVDPVDELIHQFADDNTLLYFPAGEYKIHQYRNNTGEYGEFAQDQYVPYEHFGLAGASSGETVLVPREGQGSDAFGTGYFHRTVFELRYGGPYLVEGFTFDYSAPKTGHRIQVNAERDFVVRDIEVIGLMDNPDGVFGFDVYEQGYHGLVENVRVPDGSLPDAVDPSPTRPSRATGMRVGSSHQGTITIRNCVVEGFADNGLYASTMDDPAAVQVEGGLFRNSNVAQVRLGTARSYVRNARVEVTEDIQPGNNRGIRVSDGGSGVRIENCDVLMTADVGSNGAIAGAYSGGTFLVENTRVRTEAPFDAAAIFAAAPEFDFDETAVELENVSITGDSSGGTAVRIIERDASSIRNACIHQSGADRDGITLEEADLTITESMVDVAGDRFVTEEDSAVETRNLRSTGRCPPLQP